jgi:hypothetical protein
MVYGVMPPVFRGGRGPFLFDLDSNPWFPKKDMCAAFWRKMGAYTGFFPRINGFMGIFIDFTV